MTLPLLILSVVSIATIVCLILGVRRSDITEPRDGPTCPDCGKGEMRWLETRDTTEDGYRDRRSLWQCSACGVIFEETDLERELIGGGDAA